MGCRPFFSVFTATNNNDYLWGALGSLELAGAALLKQGIEFEWVIVSNNCQVNESILKEFSKHDWVRFHNFYEENSNVGYWKSKATSLCLGEIFVELDHDDMLVPNALVELYNVVKSLPEFGFFYSDNVYVDDQGDITNPDYGQYYGWTEEKKNSIGDNFYFESFSAHPHNLSYIWYAPNHLRAWRRRAYEEAGGHDPEMSVLDDQKLMCETYLKTKFAHIKSPLYVQSVHLDSTQVVRNADIQQGTLSLYDRYIEPMMLKWCERNNLKAIDLGGAHNPREGYETVDLTGSPDHLVDFLKLNFPANSVGLIRAVDFMEHVQDKIAFIKKVYELLVDGGMLLSLTPSTDGRGAFQDPTHVAFYNENSFWYYTNNDYKKYVSDLEDVRFQTSKLCTLFDPSDSKIHYVQANLIAIKNNNRIYGGPLLV
jgi:hypothetical protein